jgi:hypothetical protein
VLRLTDQLQLLNVFRIKSLLHYDMAPIRGKAQTAQTRKSTPNGSLDHAILKQKLKITPKTATMLMQIGYNDYRDLRTASPSHIVQQFKEQLRMTHKMADPYKTPMRRIVWIGTQDNPEEHEKICSDWTQRELKAKGVWSEDFDKLTGDEIEERLKKTKGDKVEEKLKKAKGD